ncbi:hypothetical protein [Mycobacteroides franklinii]|nr:hypothetical protein [Mycobacteroides franklinii]
MPGLRWLAHRRPAGIVAVVMTAEAASAALLVAYSVTADRGSGA